MPWHQLGFEWISISMATGSEAAPGPFEILQAFACQQKQSSAWGPRESGMRVCPDQKTTALQGTTSALKGAITVLDHMAQMPGPEAAASRPMTDDPDPTDGLAVLQRVDCGAHPCSLRLLSMS